MNKFGLFSLGVAAGSAGMVSAFGDTVAYNNLTVAPPLDAFGGSIGLDFDVNKSITVTRLGVFDNGDISNLAGVTGKGVDVAIFDRSTHLPVGSVVHFSTSQSGDSASNRDVFQSLGASSFVLPIGFQGSIVAFDPFFYNSHGFANTFSGLNSGGGAISFVGSGRYLEGGKLDYPVNPDGGPVNRYDAGTFAYAVPTPSALCGGILLLGIASGGMFTKRHRLRA